MKHVCNFFAIALVALGAFILGFHNFTYVIQKEEVEESRNSIPLAVFGGGAVIMGAAILLLNAKRV